MCILYHTFCHRTVTLQHLWPPYAPDVKHPESQGAELPELQGAEQLHVNNRITTKYSSG